MSQRTCVSCGEARDLKGGKTCDSGHFVCTQCVWKSAGASAATGPVSVPDSLAGHERGHATE